MPFALKLALSPLWLANRSARGFVRWWAGEHDGPLFVAWLYATPFVGIGWFVFALVSEGFDIGLGGAMPFFVGVGFGAWWLLVGAHALLESAKRAARQQRQGRRQWAR